MDSTTKTVLCVEGALDAARAEYIRRNSTSKRLHYESERYMPGGNTRTTLYVAPFSLTFASGDEAELTSVDGDVYIDFLGDYSAGIFGHSSGKIKKAISHALSQGWNFGGQCADEKILAKAVVERFGAIGIEQVRFTNSGTEANTLAIAAAINFTGRCKILVFSGAYHGSTLTFPLDIMQNSYCKNANLPHDFVFAPYNNIAETRAIIDNLPTDSLAAILLEPMQGSGGCRPAIPEFVRFLREEAGKTGALLIIDEVMTSRFGDGGYSTLLGVKADLVTLGKYVGGGMTFGAFGGRRDIMALFDPSKAILQHAGTYNNNVITMAAGIAGFDIYNTPASSALNERGRKMKIAIQEVFVRHGLYSIDVLSAHVDIIEVDSFRERTLMITNGSLNELPRMFISGYGSMLSIRFTGCRRLQWQALFYHHMLSRHIYLATRGYIALHLAITDDHVAKFVSAVEDFVDVYKKAILSHDG